MKTTLHFFILSGLVFMVGACNDQPGTTLQEVKPGNELVIKDRDTVAIKETDTIIIKNYQLVFAPANNTVIPDFLEQHGIKLSGGQMVYFTRYKDGIGLHLENGDTTILKNDAAGSKEYHFFAHIPGSNYYLVRVQYPEGNAYLLVNTHNGKQTDLVGLPYVSPSKKYMVAVNEDLVAGHSPNALQLLTIENDSLSHQFTLDLKGWGPEKIKWLSDNSFVIQKKTATENRAAEKIDTSVSYSLVTIQKK